MGGGGGGGRTFSSRTPEELARLVREAESQSTDKAFGANLSAMLSDLLSEANARDDKLVRERLDDVKHALEREIDGSIDQLFGGSVAKHTYVDGMSDIDSLVILNDTALAGVSPQRALDRMTDTLRDAITGAAVDHGRMAVTLTYNDGMQIQLLPAVEVTDGGLKVPSSRRDGWSHIDPAAFQAALTSRNEQCAGRLVPTIKLAKAINGTLPEANQLSGYHMESLAIAAFKGYDGTKTVAAMLPSFFEKAKDLVLDPIRDSTGQSIHVDGYLGAANSAERRAASHVLGRIAKRMRVATSAQSIAQWEALFAGE